MAMYILSNIADAVKLKKCQIVLNFVLRGTILLV